MIEAFAGGPGSRAGQPCVTRASHSWLRNLRQVPRWDKGLFGVRIVGTGYKASLIGEMKILLRTIHVD